MSKEEFVSVSADRLRKLEELEAKIPHLIDEAIKEYKIQALKRLHEKDKLNPKAVAERARRYVEKNRDVLNERRRLKRKEQSKSSPTSQLVIKSPPELVMATKSPLRNTGGSASLENFQVWSPRIVTTTTTTTVSSVSLPTVQTAAATKIPNIPKPPAGNYSIGEARIVRFE